MHAETTTALPARPDAGAAAAALRKAAARASPALLMAAAVAATVYFLTPQWWTASVHVVLLYLVTPLAKEAWIPLAETQFGLPAVFAASLLLLVDVTVCLFVLRAVPVEAVLARLPRVGRGIARFSARVRASRLARRSLAGALWVALLLPIHSGGAILGTLAGRGMGLTPMATFVAVTAAVAARFGLVVLAFHGFLIIHG